MLLQAQALPDSARRPLALLAIAALHVLLIAALANGFAQRVFGPVVDPAQVRVILQPRETPRPADLPAVTIDPVKTFFRPKEPQIDDPPPPIGPATDTQVGPTAISELPPVPSTKGGAPAPPPVVLLGRHQLPNTEEYYPAASRRLGEEGAAQARACVNEAGRLAGTPQLVSSSGHKLLDEAAIELLRAGHYARATRGGMPIANCYDFRVTFRFR
jgi:periplasmic protein TonB